jgi:hypothetical protein
MINQRVNSVCHTEEENFIDTEIENAHCLRDLITDHGENTNMQALQHMAKNAADLRQFHPKISKSPTPNMYHNTSQVTPTSMTDMRMSTKYPYVLMNQQELERVNQRNNQLMIPNSKSHQV